MKLKNTTNVPESLLREVIRFVCPSSVTNFSIWFKRAGGGKRVFFAGRAYCNENKVSIRIPKWTRLLKPYTGCNKVGQGYRPWVSVTFEEALVAIVAHELRHLAQHKNPRLYRQTPYARGQYSELDCDTYANEMIVKWRAVHGPETKAPGAKPLIPGRAKPLTPRQRLEALAAPYGVQLSLDYMPDGLTYWVNAPHSLCDGDGEMEGDPYADGHYHDDYHAAKEAIEVYSRLARIKALTPVGSGVFTLPSAISLDSVAQPATVIA